MTDSDRNSSLQDRLHRVREQVDDCLHASNRNAGEVRLIAVSKTRSLAEVEALAKLGQHAFAENTIQDALTKIPYTTSLNEPGLNEPGPNGPGLEWHFIGHLQSKKAGKIPVNFQWIHTVDSLKLAEKLSAAVQRQDSPVALDCLVQVNASKDPAKSGISTDEAHAFFDNLLASELPGLNWRGLMTIGVQGDDKRTRNSFASLRALRDNLQGHTGLKDFDQLSMGMSNDFCVAIEEGATMVRIGSSIFGMRQYG